MSSNPEKTVGNHAVLEVRSHEVRSLLEDVGDLRAAALKRAAAGVDSRKDAGNLYRDRVALLRGAPKLRGDRVQLRLRALELRGCARLGRSTGGHRGTP